MSELENGIASALLADAADLGARWCERAPVVAGIATRSRADRYSEVVEEIVELVRSVARSLGPAELVAPELAWIGWRFGRTRFESDGALHQVLQELHLVEAIVLHDAQRLIAEGTLGGSAHEGLAIARTLQRAMALASLAAVRGFTHAYLDRQQHRFRMLRHDLRNPLGTIRNAIALLEDESIPTHLRDPERFRAIVARNAKQADAMVTRDLADRMVLDAALVRQEVAVTEVAHAVRRTLRSAAEAAQAEIVVADGLPVITADVASLELVLLAAVGAALESVAAGGVIATRIVIEPEAARDRSVRIRIASGHRAVDAVGIRRARELARWAGGEITVSDAILVELPASPRDAGDDLAGASER